VWAILLLLCLPLLAGLATHLSFVNRLIALQEQRHDLARAQEQVHLLRRLTADIEDGFRGYLLTQQPIFLAPLTDAEAKLDAVMATASHALSDLAGPPNELVLIERQLKELLQSKHELIADVQRGEAEKAWEYVRSGEGLKLSDGLREHLRSIEDRLEQRRESSNAQADALSKQTFAGLWIALVGLMVLGLISSRILDRSLTDPIRRLHSAAARMGEDVDAAGIAELLTVDRLAKDELGRLAEAYLDMTRRIATHIREIDVLDTIGHEINTIGPDGLDGVLRRITDRAVELVQADVCLVLLRDDRMGCWVVAAASGEWNDRLKQSVMLWEELPVSVEAFETRRPATGNRFRSDERPHVARRNVIGESMLAIPLLAQGIPFGVLSLLSERPRESHEWNHRLAKGLAQEAALAISNARLYEAAQEKQRGLLARLRQLEHLAETLAHDLKGPGSRMEELARLLAQKFSGHIDERTAKWLKLLQENGRDIVQRVEGILEVARVGSGQGSVTAVDPRLVIDQVLKTHAGEIEQTQAEIRIDPAFPLVACHGAYVRQVFDNLISNALKYARPGEKPFIAITSQTDQNMVSFAVQDRGIGIPADQRGRVFLPFVRLTQPDGKGSGIGLTIVQRIVELYGGQVWIEETDGGGCAVKFTLPRLSDAGSREDGRADESEVVDVSKKDFL
jgi:signal transduction histidine kinase/CHASE3 domain sensor protein